MKIELITEFSVPIWRFFYSDTCFKLPWEFTYKQQTYRNYIAIICLGWCAEKLFKHDTNYLDENIILNAYTENHIICFPTQLGVDLCKKYRPRLNPCLASHNSFIDENLYNIDLTQNIKYNLVVSSAFSKYKNLDLIKNLDKTIGYGYGLEEKGGYRRCHPSNVKIINFTDKSNIEYEKPRVKENYRHIEPIETIKLINSSKIGGIFSTTEGSCFSSGEYLLCGVPVLSCKCRGGRETFYNSENSILCEPTHNSVEKAFKEILKKYNEGKFDRKQIRENHIKIMETQRDNLTLSIIELMNKIINPVNQPTFLNLRESLKYYHSNNRGFNYTKGYETQTNRERAAGDVLAGNH